MTADEEIKLPPAWRAWQIREFLGKGSFGKVYKAEKTSGGVSAWSAIKVVEIPPDDSEIGLLMTELHDQDAVREYFKDQAETYAEEIETMYSLQGISNIVSIQDHAVVPAEDGPGWVIFIRMELLTPFLEYQVTHPMQEKDIIRLGESICRALIRCGTKGIIHRDIKPGNIFVTDDEDFKLGDFGVAKHLDYTANTYSVKGTFAYMAPEVCNREAYDGRADLYSLGLILYKLANHNTDALLDKAKKLHTRKDKETAFERRMKGEPLPPPSGCSKALAGVILKACAFRQEDRYRNAQEMLTALTALNTAKPKRRKKTFPLKAVLAAVIIAGCGLTIAALGGRYFIYNHPTVSEKTTGQEKSSEKETEKVTEEATLQKTEKVTEEATLQETEKVTEETTLQETENVMEEAAVHESEEVTEEATVQQTGKASEEPAPLQ